MSVIVANDQKFCWCNGPDFSVGLYILWKYSSLVNLEAQMLEMLWCFYRLEFLLIWTAEIPENYSFICRLDLVLWPTAAIYFLWLLEQMGHRQFPNSFKTFGDDQSQNQSHQLGLPYHPIGNEINPYYLILSVSKLQKKRK